MKKTILLIGLLSGIALGNTDTTVPPSHIQDGFDKFHEIEEVEKGDAFALIFDWNGIDKTTETFFLDLKIMPNGMSDFQMFRTSLRYINGDGDGVWAARNHCGPGVGTESKGLPMGCVTGGTFILQHTVDGDNSVFTYKLVTDTELITLASASAENYIDGLRKWGEMEGSSNFFPASTNTISTFAAVTGTISNIEVWRGEIKSPEDLEAGAAVPEPTTATLSLLALAGLCARRRR